MVSPPLMFFQLGFNRDSPGLRPKANLKGFLKKRKLSWNEPGFYQTYSGQLTLTSLKLGYEPGRVRKLSKNHWKVIVAWSQSLQNLTLTLDLKPLNCSQLFDKFFVCFHVCMIQINEMLEKKSFYEFSNQN